MRCNDCGRNLTRCPARWDGEDTFVGFYPCECNAAREEDAERAEWRGILDQPHCSVCGKYCWGDPGTAEEPVAVDGEIVCGECADEIAIACDGEGADRRTL